MPNPDLAQVASAFEQWRQTRKTKKSKIPQHLREQALALRECHKISHITKTLGLSHGSLSSWAKLHDQKEASSFPTFIPLEAAESQHSSPNNREIVITHPNGCCITIKGGFSFQELMMLTQPLPHQEDA